MSHCVNVPKTGLFSDSEGKKPNQIYQYRAVSLVIVTVLLCLFICCELTSTRGQANRALAAPAKEANTRERGRFCFLVGFDSQRMTWHSDPWSCRHHRCHGRRGAEVLSNIYPFAAGHADSLEQGKAFCLGRCWSSYRWKQWKCWRMISVSTSRSVKCLFLQANIFIF